MVLCGPGNNGGDGFVIARLLAGRGWAVEVYLYGDADRLPPDARANYDLWCEIGAVRALRADMLTEDGFTAACDLIIDALFGTGLTRAVDLPLAALAARSGARERGPRLVAVDLPSGLCSDSGRRIGTSDVAGPADLTVTFHSRKCGHVLGEGPALCGPVRVVDIGLAGDAAADMALALLVEAPSGGLEKRVWHHKYDHGHALILSGGCGRGGAARLAARGALRIGAGLVTLGCPPGALQENAARLDAVMLTALRDAAGLAAVLSDHRLNAVCLGPGLGQGRAREMVPAVLEQGAAPPRGVVLDADALSAYAGDPEALLTRVHPGCVLTPHGGEFARLFPEISARLQSPAEHGPAFSRIDATRAAAAQAGCTVLLKGPDTVIADQTGAVRVHAAIADRAAPWLATAGAGDVLAGFITGLLARGLPPLEAAATGAWLHVETARSFGPGLIAEDLPDALPGVLRSIGL